jgi:hypothetical protein
MMDRNDKRKYRRLAAQFDISCRTVGSPVSQTREGSTVNISPGGVYFRTTSDTFQQGDLLRVELRIPPTSHLLEFGGKMEGFAKVLRTDNYRAPLTRDELADKCYGVALQFCRRPKLCV